MPMQAGSGRVYIGCEDGTPRLLRVKHPHHNPWLPYFSSQIEACRAWAGVLSWANKASPPPRGPHGGVKDGYRRMLESLEREACTTSSIVGIP